MHQSKVIFLEELRDSMRERRLLVILVLYFALMAFAVKKSTAYAAEFYIFLNSFLFKAQGAVPFELLLFYFISVIALPVLALLISYDCIAGEISRKTMRPLAAAARRHSVILGKFFSVFLITALSNLAAFLIAAAYNYFRNGGDYLGAALKLSLYLAFYAFYFVALAVLASSATSSSARALFLGIFLYCIPLFFVFSRFLAKLSPYSYFNNGFHLLSSNFAPVRNGVLLFTISGILFLLLSILLFRRRDL